MELKIEVKLSEKEHSLISGALLARVKAAKENADECREDSSNAEYWNNVAREYQAVYDKLCEKEYAKSMETWDKDNVRQCIRCGRQLYYWHYLTMDEESGCVCVDDRTCRRRQRTRKQKQLLKLQKRWSQ
jgi:hypothetical protein